MLTFISARSISMCSPSPFRLPPSTTRTMAVEEVLAPCTPRGAAAHALAPWIISPFARKLGVDLARPFCSAPASLWDEDDDLHNWELVDYSCTGSEILAKPSSNGGLNQEEWPSEDMLPPSWNGGSDIHIDSHAIGAMECISAQHSLYLQMALLSDAWDVIGEDVQDGSVFSYPNAVTLHIGAARGSVSSDVVTVPHQVYCEGINRNTSKVTKKGSGAPGSEPDKTDWQQQQQQEEVEGTHGTLNNVDGPRLIGVDPRLSGAFATAGDKGWLPVCQGKMETSATTLWEISANNSGSVICEAECKNISGLAAAEYLIEQHFLVDNAVLVKQLCNGVSAVSSPEQKIGEPEDHSGYGSPVAGVHGVSIAPKKKDPGTTWLIASAAPHHATGNRALLSGFAPDHGDLFVKAGDAGSAPMRVAGRGNVVTDAVVLPDVWYVPGLAVNVASVSQLAELDYSVVFGHGQCCVRSGEDGGVVGTARAGEDGLFALDFIKVPLGI